MGTTSLQPFLKSYWLMPVQMTGQLSQSMQILMSSRGSINAKPATITSESDTEPARLESSEHGDHRDVSFPLSGNQCFAYLVRNNVGCSRPRPRGGESPCWVGSNVQGAFETSARISSRDSVHNPVGKPLFWSESETAVTGSEANTVAVHRKCV